MEVVNMKDRWLRSVAVTSGRQEYGDAIIRGLRLRVSNRTKKWSVVTRRDGRQIRKQIGEYPTLGVSKARQLAASLIEEPDLDISSEIDCNVQSKFDNCAPTLVELFEDYVAKMVANGQRSASSYRRALIEGKYSFCKFMSTKPGYPQAAKDVETSHVVEWLKLTFDRSPSHSRHYRSYLRAAYEWGLKSRFNFMNTQAGKDYQLEINPVAITPRGPAAKPRKRVLSPEELSQLWCVLPNHASPRAYSEKWEPVFGKNAR